MLYERKRLCLTEFSSEESPSNGLPVTNRYFTKFTSQTRLVDSFS